MASWDVKKAVTEINNIADTVRSQMFTMNGVIAEYGRLAKVLQDEKAALEAEVERLTKKNEELLRLLKGQG